MGYLSKTLFQNKISFVFFVSFVANYVVFETASKQKNPGNRTPVELFQHFCAKSAVERFSGPPPPAILFRHMGRQWLLAKRLVSGLKKSKTNTKAVREIT